MEAIGREVPSFVPAVPPLYQRIVDEAERRNVSITGIRYALSGAMPLPAPLVERWESATGGLLVEGYGRTETSPVIVGNPMTKERRPGAIGVPFPDVEIRIADPEDLDREVRQGERGELTIVDRIKEIIITGGFNVYPSEVEAVLRTHAGVVDVAVVGLPHEDGGEEVVAVVVLVEGVPVLPDELRSHTRQGLTPYKVPRRVVFMDELPTNPMGKVLRREVVARLREA